MKRVVVCIGKYQFQDKFSYISLYVWTGMYVEQRKKYDMKKVISVRMRGMACLLFTVTMNRPFVWNLKVMESILCQYPYLWDHMVSKG